VKKYGAWWSGPGEGRANGWLSVGQIRQAFHNSWDRGLEAAGLKPSIGALARRYERTWRPSASALLRGVVAVAAARECSTLAWWQYRESVEAFLQHGGMADEGAPGEPERLASAIAQARECGEAVTVTISLDTFRRYVGCWSKVLAEAGLEPLRPAGRDTHEVVAGPYSEDDLCEDLRCADRELRAGGRIANLFMSWRQYDRWAIDATQTSLGCGAAKTYAPRGCDDCDQLAMA
jgi:hypothetical protein